MARVRRVVYYCRDVEIVVIITNLICEFLYIYFLVSFLLICESDGEFSLEGVGGEIEVGLGEVFFFILFLRESLSYDVVFF